MIVFAYEKIDNHESRAAVLNFQYAIFVDRERTGDYLSTYGLREIIHGNKDDLVAFLEERSAIRSSLTWATTER